MSIRTISVTQLVKLTQINVKIVRKDENLMLIAYLVHWNEVFTIPLVPMCPF